MNYRNLIKTLYVDNNPSTYNEEPTDVICSYDNCETSIINDSNNKALSDEKIDKLISLLETSQPMMPPESIEKAELTDDEANEVLSYLLYLQTEYFSEIPLARELCKQFVWNMPREVYEAYSTTKKYEEPDVINPLIFLYILCTEDPYFSMGKYVNIINNLIGPDEMNLIERKIEEGESYEIMEDE
jgi:hypothetical protein